MTMRPESQELRHVARTSIAAPIDAVWRELTTPGRVQRFYFDSALDLEPTIGAQVRYRDVRGRRTIIEGQVLAFEPPRRFAHTLRFTNLPDPPTRVEWQLTASGAGTSVTIVHDGFTEATRTYRLSARGWPQILANLRSWLEEGRLPLRTRAQYVVMRLVAPLLLRERGDRHGRGAGG